MDNQKELQGDHPAGLRARTRLVVRLASLDTLLNQFTVSIPAPLTARELMLITEIQVALRELRTSIATEDSERPPSDELLESGHRIVNQIESAVDTPVADPDGHDLPLSLSELASEISPDLDRILEYIDPTHSPDERRRDIMIQTFLELLTRQSANAEKQAARLEQAIAKNRGEAENRGAQFRVQLNDQQRQVQLLLDEINRSDAVRAAKLESETREMEKRYKSLCDQAERLIGTVALSGIATGHLTAEAREREIANRWRLAAITFAIIAIVAVGLSSWLLKFQGLEQLIVTHAGIILGLGALAAYSGRQSAEHRREERWLRDTQLRLVAATVWIEDLPTQVREALKSDLVEPLLLGRPVERGDVTPSATSPLLNGQVMQLMAKLLRAQEKEESPEESIERKHPGGKP